MAFFNKKKEQTPRTEAKRSVAVECLDYLHDIVYLLAVILLVLTFCFRVVIVSGSSMFSTLVDGDYLLLINNPLCGELEQGDIVVASMDRFRDSEAIVKRVIATEGQTVDIDFRQGIVYVDGVAPEIGLVDEREILGRAVFLMLPGTGRGEYTVERDFGRIGGLD